MPLMERDTIHQGIDENGNPTVDYPMARLGWIDTDAGVKAAPTAEDYIPLIDSADNAQMKKVLISALAQLIGITVDTELSATSENPVQNKAIEAALKLKAAASHKHSAGDITGGVLPAARGGTGATSIAGLTEAIATALTGSADLSGKLSAAMGACKIQTGSYTGTGTYGSANPCKLTFDFVPRLLLFFHSGVLFRVYSVTAEAYPYAPIIFCDGLTTNYTEVMSFSYMPEYGQYGTATLNAKKSADGKTIFIYGTLPDLQLNENGGKYYYMAIG